VKHVLNRHAASLHIESTPGQGSTFRCDFPAASIVRLDDHGTGPIVQCSEGALPASDGSTSPVVTEESAGEDVGR
jgi:hypothetical protein